jgi:hypothetical protein
MFGGRALIRPEPSWTIRMPLIVTIGSACIASQHGSQMRSSSCRGAPVA